MKVQTLKGIGPKIAKLLQALGIEDVQDILFHLPYRYQDRTRVVPIADLRAKDAAVIEGEIIASQIKFAGKRQLVVTLQDTTGAINLRFFYFNAAQQKNLAVGTKLRCYGEVKQFRRELQMIHPEYRQLHAQSAPVEESLTPLYPSTEGMHQAIWYNLSTQALRFLKSSEAEILPVAVRQKYQLPDLPAAITLIHRPPPDVQQDLLMQGIHPMQQRLVFEELLAHQVSLLQLRQQFQTHQAYAMPATAAKKLQEQFLAALPFTITNAQQNAWQEIAADLQLAQPMLRLVQGDVGSGKTLVAALAALQVIANGYQVAIMAPTELLAEQHYQQFLQWFEPLGISVAWLASKLTASVRRDMLTAINSGTAKLIVGTHALFQAHVEFANLALVIVDEQHRFGVEQRHALRGKGIKDAIFPHQLIMTATPIPRTLAMTVYADLDTSIIDELPPGRTPINTIVLNNQRRDEIITRIKNLCQAGGQVYWVCPLIEESEQLQCEAAENTAAYLQATLPELKVSLVHGRMKPNEKQSIMQAFKAGQINLLVATTVIEVGINVPNASLMVIENAERMGLAQLHQLRGRVGRGAQQSYCVLLYQEPLSDNARQRLQVMRESTDGFYIAEQDLKLRGAGEVLGTKQTGLQRLRIADLIRDRKLLPKVQQAAREILQQHPEIIEPLIKRWIGAKQEFAQV